MRIGDDVGACFRSLKDFIQSRPNLNVTSYCKRLVRDLDMYLAFQLILRAIRYLFLGLGIIQDRFNSIEWMDLASSHRCLLDGLDKGPPCGETRIYRTVS